MCIHKQTNEQTTDYNSFTFNLRLLRISSCTSTIQHIWIGIRIWIWIWVWLRLRMYISARDDDISMLLSDVGGSLFWCTNRLNSWISLNIHRALTTDIILKLSLLIRYDCRLINNAQTKNENENLNEKKRRITRSEQNIFKFRIDSVEKYYMTIGRQIDWVKKLTYTHRETHTHAPINQSRSNDKCKTFPICIFEVWCYLPSLSLCLPIGDRIKHTRVNVICSHPIPPK